MFRPETQNLNVDASSIYSLMHFMDVFMELFYVSKNLKCTEFESIFSSGFMFHL